MNQTNKKELLDQEEELPLIEICKAILSVLQESGIYMKIFQD